MQQKLSAAVLIKPALTFFDLGAFPAVCARQGGNARGIISNAFVDFHKASGRPNVLAM
jgi:hypothetical protein